MGERPFFIRAEGDEDARVWVATSDDVPGRASWPAPAPPAFRMHICLTRYTQRGVVQGAWTCHAGREYLSFSP